MTYENYGDDPISVGTLMNSISLSSPVYASPNVSGSYKYGCSYYINGVAQAWGPGNLVQYMSGVPIAVGYNVFSGQGTRLLHNLNPCGTHRASSPFQNHL